MNFIKNLTLKICKYIGLGILIVVTFLAITLGLSEVTDFNNKQQVVGIPSGSFPVLVLVKNAAIPTDYTPKIVYFRDLEQFKKENPNYTFSVPENLSSSLNKKLETHPIYFSDPREDERYSTIAWSAHFKVKNLHDSKQLLEVFADNDDDVNVSTYEASSNQIYPKNHKNYFGPGGVILIIPISLVLTIVVWIVIIFILNKRRKNIT